MWEYETFKQIQYKFRRFKLHPSVGIVFRASLGDCLGAISHALGSGGHNLVCEVFAPTEDLSYGVY